MNELERITHILQQLVAFPTISSDSNLPLIAWVEDYLNYYRVPHWRVNEQSNKASLLVRIGPEAPGGIVLSGHSDVVPVKGQPWETDPFELILRDGKFYGRGTCDMKSFLAVALALVPEWVKVPLIKPIWIAISHDEEIGCLGALPMAQALNARKVAPSLVVVGEPTSMELVSGHKAILSFETIVAGHEAHSSMPEQGVNAVMVMAELMATLGRIAQAARAQAHADSPFTTPYSSVHIGVVEGGTARNIIPRYARMAWEVRPLPGDDIDALLAPYYAQAASLHAALQRQHAHCGIVTNRLTHVRALQMETQAPHMAIAYHLAGTNHTHAVAYGTEGGIFQGEGLPVIICGPGSIDQAHQPNEFVDPEQLERCAAFMHRVKTWCVSGGC